MIERPNCSIVDYLALLVSIEGLPEAERQAAIGHKRDSDKNSTVQAEANRLRLRFATTSSQPYSRRAA